MARGRIAVLSLSPLAAENAFVHRVRWAHTFAIRIYRLQWAWTCSLFCGEIWIPI